jgi:hypothetical protein
MNDKLRWQEIRKRMLGSLSDHSVLGNHGRSLDQRRERAQRLSHRKEWMLQKLRRIGSFFDIDLKRFRKVILERRRQVLRIGNDWRAVCRD